ncbi:MAG TPA: ComEA family DNA-binding protein [Chloroflexia bacterium]|nr:ComEA family DNA-binding protein [Chloroflexia bacterium]
MRALLASRVDVAWLLLATALSGAVLVVWLALHSGSTPGGTVYIARAETTPVPGQGGAPPVRSAGAELALPLPTATPEPAPPAAEVAPTPEPTATPEIVEALQVADPTAPPAARAPTASVSKQGGRIDINRATAEELEALPGIGPVLARRIVEDREANGPYASVDDLERVNGIGKGIVAKVRDHATAGP